MFTNKYILREILAYLSFNDKRMLINTLDPIEVGINTLVDTTTLTFIEYENTKEKLGKIDKIERLKCMIENNIFNEYLKSLFEVSYHKREERGVTIRILLFPSITYPNTNNIDYFGNLQLHDPTQLHYAKLSYYSNNHPNRPRLLSSHCFQLFDEENNPDSWFVSYMGCNGFPVPLHQFPLIPQNKQQLKSVLDEMQNDNIENGQLITDFIYNLLSTPEDVKKMYYMLLNNANI
jgi:hypothetical protein